MTTFTLQILHASDLEGGVDAIDNAPNFAVVVDALEAEYDNTVILSAGDNYIPGPFYNAASDGELRDDLQAAYQTLFSNPELTNIREGLGRVDIAIMNAIGFDASAIGNHEFDNGSDAFESIIEEDVRGGTLGDIRHIGAQFPYLSANLDFTDSPDLGNLFTSDILTSDSYANTPESLLDGTANPFKIAPATIIEEGGEQIGVIGATTQRVETISSPDGVDETTAGENDMPALAAAIQPQIDALTEQGVDKIIVVSHLQQIDLEKELAGLLDGVDVIIAGGSDTLQADATDTLRDGDVAAEGYPFTTTDAEGNPVAIVSTDGEYSYVGRLVIDFDENGNIITDSIDENVSGAFATDDAGVLAVTGATSVDEAIAASESASIVEDLTDAVSDVVTESDGDVHGETAIFIDGRRTTVRTEESNMGNLTADANLAAAQAVDSEVLISLKNGGGIRAPIGSVDGNTGELLPTEANPAADKEAGEISTLDIENTLRFDNGLVIVETDAEGLLRLLEHGVAATDNDGTVPTQGRFPQIGGMRFSFDENAEEGSKVQTVAIETENGLVVIVEDGEVLDTAPETIKIVSLDFLVNNNGDGYPFVDDAEDGITGVATSVTELGVGEQQALKDFLAENFPVDGDVAFDDPELQIGQDVRIQQLAFRSDNVDAPEPTEAITLAASMTFDSGAGEGGSEIVAHENGVLYVTNGEQDRIDTFNLADGSQGASIDLSTLAGYDGVQSVAVKNGIVAVAVSADGAANGQVALYNASDLSLITSIEVGNLPDSLSFTPDGSKIVVANEGEPVDETTDPAGSISVIDLSNGSENPTVATLGFEAFDGQANNGVRTFPGENPSTDWEPEYVTIAPDGSTAYVTIQEANAVAVVDLTNNEITDVFSAGTQDHSEVGLDASDRDNAINIQTYDNLVGNRMPDAIAAFEIDGAVYAITANEGDDRGDFDEGGDAARVGDILDGEVEGVSIDESVDTTGLERLTVSIIDGDTDGDGDIDVLHSYGGRSVTIYDADGNIVWDSGESFGQIAAEFNTAEFNGNDGDFDNRSDNKGVEPEAVTVGTIKGRTFAFVGLERDSGIVVMDISNPEDPTFVDYINGSDNGNVSPEGLVFVPAEDAPGDEPLLVVSYEVSGTTVAYEIDSDELGALAASNDGGPVVGSAFEDSLEGSAEGDVALLGGGDDTARGFGGADVIAGQDGDDNLGGGGGADVLLGGAGADVIAGDGGNDVIAGGAGDDRLGGNLGDDTLLGGAGNDLLFGGQDNDRLFGGAGNDSLRGGDGEDRLQGGAGADTLTGGDDADTFVFGGAWGDDTITDFTDGEDLIAINLPGTTGSLEDVTIVQQGDDVQVSFGESSITVENTSVDALGEDDFLFS